MVINFLLSMKRKRVKLMNLFGEFQACLPQSWVSLAGHVTVLSGLGGRWRQNNFNPGTLATCQTKPGNTENTAGSGDILIPWTGERSTNM